MTAFQLKQEVHLWADKINVKPVEVHIRKMKNKWASCSGRGRLTFNSNILDEEDGFINEVIVHELLHLKYPNHGRMFKTLLKTYVGSEL
ncbi:MAG: M48 family metallopeptidase [Nitrospirae bacterium]|nr:M48 family metallopeptidase [Nitrospirota bacterium]MBF0616651.1 M48 family metallopeptidase [Nitrospirota bacterium]